MASDVDPGSPELPARPAALLGPRWLHGIRARIFATLALMAGGLAAALALIIERDARRELEFELDLRLRAVGGAAVSLIGPGLVPGLLALSPGQETFRLYQDRKLVLAQLKERTGVRRIFLSDPGGRAVVDSDPRISIGVPLPQVRSDRREIQAVLAGEPATGPLYVDASGQYRKTGYVPVLAGDRVIAMVGVEADAEFLSAVRALRRRLFIVGGAGVVVAFLSAALFARGLTRPIDHLVEWARGLGRGDLTTPVPLRRSDEIGFLARTLDEMRVEVAARDREQRAMVAGVAHEIRNPLGGIRLYAELLSGDPAIGETAKGRLAKILSELDHLGAVVEQFLQYARPSGPMPQPVALDELLAGFVESLAPQAAARGVRLSSSIAAAARVQSDPTHLRQILHNLLRNAIEACREGGEVRISIGHEEAQVAIRIEDDGPGITKELRDRLFEPFFTTKTAGAGLGLAIVQRLVLLNRGRIEVEDRDAGGARFVVYLPGADG